MFHLRVPETALPAGHLVAIALVLLTPFVVISDTIFPFVVGTGLWSRATIEILFVLWTLLALANPSFRPPVVAAAAPRGGPWRFAALGLLRGPPPAQRVVELRADAGRGGPGAQVRVRARADVDPAHRPRPPRASCGHASVERMSYDHVEKVAASC